MIGMPKTFLLAPDSFKESMTALQACYAMQAGIIRVFPDAAFILLPMADGGEGTVDALLHALHGTRVHVQVAGSLAGQQVQACFGLIDDGRTAVIEMAQANGLNLLAPEQRNPFLTSTHGTGQLILAALDQQVTKIIIGLGGSATSDGGAGMAQALGVRFYDAAGNHIRVHGGNLQQIQRMDISQLDERLKQVELIIASDVNNPLTGLQGAAHVFAPQKGATPDMVLQLDAGLQHFASLIKQQLGQDISHIAGAGAAGGLGAGLLAFAGARMTSGVQLVIGLVGLVQQMARADYVFTGEGSIDCQTSFGKTLLGVAQVAKQLNKPVFACAGYVGDGIDSLYTEGFTAIFGILDKPGDLQQALADGEKNLGRTCENIARVLVSV